MATSGLSIVVWVLCVIALIVFSWPIVTSSGEPFRTEDFWHFVGVWLLVLVASRGLGTDAEPGEALENQNDES